MTGAHENNKDIQGVAKGVKINTVAFYQPDHQVDNQYYIDRYDDLGVNVRGLIESLGKDTRYIIDNEDENAVTMAIIAAKSALDKAGLSAEDIDMILFVSQTPEYLIPTNALKIHAAIGGKLTTSCFDLNGNCSGILVAVEQASRNIIANNYINRVLVVGADYISTHSLGEPIFDCNFADSALAVIVERAETTGFIDSEYQTDTSVIDNALFPRNGLSSWGKPEDGPRMKFEPFDTSAPVGIAVASIERLLERNGLTKDDIGSYYLSQFAPGNIEGVIEGLGVDKAKALYIGDKYGYTSTNSPFTALYEAIETGKVSRGDYIVLWTVGAGWQNVSLLFQY